MASTLFACRVTLGLIAIAIVAFVGIGPGPLDIAPQSQGGLLLEAMLNAFRHGDIGHLFMNSLIILWAGVEVESRQGSATAFGLAAGAIIIGTSLQLYFVDGNFLGLSGVAYCFAVSRFMMGAGPGGILFLLFAGLVFVSAEIRYLSDTVAAYAHLGGVITAGGWSMFRKLFGQNQDRQVQPPADPDQPYLAALEPQHVSRVVEIIHETDEDDAEDAEEVLRRRGCDGMYALWHQERIVGVTGYAATEAENDTAWLSWTYLETQAQGKALGRFMLDELLRLLNKQKIRKIFIATSDYTEDGVDVYADARKFYASLGGKLELTLPGFYADDENKLIYGLVNPGMGKEESLDELGDRGVALTGVELDEDSDDVGAILWEEAETPLSGVDRIRGLANSNKFRLCFAALPADMSDYANADLIAEGFERIGMLEDYYAFGLGQVWWRLKLT